MANPDLFYLSLASVSSVLLGICVSLRNNAYATVLRHYEDEIRLGNLDYEPILNRSAQGAMGSGLFFALTIAVSFGGLFTESEEVLGAAIFLVTMTFFVLGLLVLVYSLLTGHLKNPGGIFRSPNKPNRSERPEVESGDED